MASHKEAKLKALSNQQWQQQGGTKGWGDTKGIKYGGEGIGWQADGGMPAKAQGQHIPGVSLPPQMDAAAGVHFDAFRMPDERLQEQQLNPFVFEPKKGLAVVQIAAQS